MNGLGYLVAAYVGSALLYGLYTWRLLRRERVLDRRARATDARGSNGG